MNYWLEQSNTETKIIQLSSGVVNKRKLKSVEKNAKIFHAVSKYAEYDSILNCLADMSLNLDSEKLKPNQSLDNWII